jgi:pyruvate-ferredoxin/flavodoxin oxidoreductase
MMIPLILNGRYGLGSAEFTPPWSRLFMTTWVLARRKILRWSERRVAFTSLKYDKTYNIEGTDVFRALFLVWAPTVP